MEVWNKLKQNHLLLMIICCLLPFLLIFIVIYGFGIRNAYTYWIALLLCPISHLIMMKFMDHGKKEKEGCH